MSHSDIDHLNGTIANAGDMICDAISGLTSAVEAIADRTSPTEAQLRGDSGDVPEGIKEALPLRVEWNLAGVWRVLCIDGDCLVEFPKEYEAAARWIVDAVNRAGKCEAPR